MITLTAPDAAIVELSPTCRVLIDVDEKGVMHLRRSKAGSPIVVRTLHHGDEYAVAEEAQ